MASSVFFKSSLVKKFWMGITGLFLITFLVVHAGINSMIFFNDSGVTFNAAAHFMGHNIIIRTMEIGLFLGLILHVVDGLVLNFQNRKARPVRYAKESPNTSSKWYSRSMALLGTLILLFLVVHLANFFVVSRGIVGSLDELKPDAKGQENLFSLMVTVFGNPIVVVIYLLGCFSLFWHLLHGFKSAFQSLGLNNSKYKPGIALVGDAFSVLISVLFASMPLAIYFKFIQ
ncbi:MAG: succinate dehydrogenase cytochrome b subunit [Crocinitomicaceae bacterium]|nr:succinate dehydrogenase cytochrome b subunit [Crocinitomicaceae bacterium]